MGVIDFVNKLHTAQFNFSNIYDGGFAGISKEGLENLKASLENYYQKLKDVADNFNENVELDESIKGSVLESTRTYLKETKNYLFAYIDALRIEIDDIDNAYLKYEESINSLSNTVDDKAQEIRQNASNVTLD